MLPVCAEDDDGQQIISWGTRRAALQPQPGVVYPLRLPSPAETAADLHQNCSSGNEARAPGPNTRCRQCLLQRLASLPLLGQHPALVNTEDYHEVDPNGFAETLLAFGEVFLQQVSPGQRQVVRTRGARQQLVGKRHVNKLQGNSTWHG